MTWYMGCNTYVVFLCPFQIFFVIWLRDSEWYVPNLLMHSMAVVLSKKTFTWIPWSLTIDMRLKKMDFNSRAFKLKFLHSMPLPMHWCISVNNWITFVSSGYCSFLETVKRIFIHHCRLRIASFVNLVNTSKLVFAFFNPKVLKLSSFWEHRGPNLFPGKFCAKVPIRIDNSLIVKYLILKTFLQDSRIFSIFSLVSVTNVSSELKTNPE